MIDRMVHGRLVSLLCAALALGCGSNQPAPDTPAKKQARAEPHEEAAGDEIPDGFKRIEEKPIGFSVIVPVNAERQDVKREGIAPGAWMWVGQTEEGSIYTVAYFGALDVSDTDREEQLAGTLFGIMQGCQGRLISAKRGRTSWGDLVLFAGMCGAGEPVIGRLHLQKGHMYAIFGIAKTAQARAPLRAFLSSFRVIP
jgi:hypothetical protein